MPRFRMLRPQWQTAQALNRSSRWIGLFVFINNNNDDFVCENRWINSQMIELCLAFVENSLFPFVRQPASHTHIVCFMPLASHQFPWQHLQLSCFRRLRVGSVRACLLRMRVCVCVCNAGGSVAIKGYVVYADCGTRTFISDTHQAPTHTSVCAPYAF